jgi:hypothetical protein
VIDVPQAWRMQHDKSIYYSMSLNKMEALLNTDVLINCFPDETPKDKIILRYKVQLLILIFYLLNNCQEFRQLKNTSIIISLENYSNIDKVIKY